MLAHGAVHGAFAGYTNFCVGPINSRYTYIPLTMIAERTNVVSVNDRMWGRVLFSTGQPDFRNDGEDDSCDISYETAYGGCTRDIRVP